MFHVTLDRNNVIITFSDQEWIMRQLKLQNEAEFKNWLERTGYQGLMTTNGVNMVYYNAQRLQDMAKFALGDASYDFAIPLNAPEYGNLDYVWLYSGEYSVFGRAYNVVQGFETIVREALGFEMMNIERTIILS